MITKNYVGAAGLPAISCVFRICKVRSARIILSLARIWGAGQDMILQSELDETDPETSIFSTRFGIMEEWRVLSPI
jgi:hypothetical protein